MEKLKAKIREEGKAIGTEIVKVDNFLNHQIDVKFLEEVGKEFAVTRERVRQIEAKALRKMRHPIRSKKLKGFLEDISPDSALSFTPS